MHILKKKGGGKTKRLNEKKERKKLLFAQNKKYNFIFNNCYIKYIN